MVLFAHLQNSSGIDVEGTIRSLPGFTPQRAFDRSANEEEEVSDYWFGGTEIKVQVRRRKDKPELVTVETDLEDAEQTTLTRFREYTERLEKAGLSTVSDRVALSDYEHSLYWGRISSFIESCRPRLGRIWDTLTPLIDPRTKETVMAGPIDNKDCKPDQEIGIEFDKVRKRKSLEDLKEIREDHLDILGALGEFIQYADISKQAKGRADPKVAGFLSDILDLSYDLLSRPRDHNSFMGFLNFVKEKDAEDMESLYHTLDLIHAGAVLVRGEMAKTFPQVSKVNEVLLDLATYGPVYVTMQKIKQITESLGLRRINTDRLLGSKYSGGTLLNTLVDVENALSKTGEEDSKLTTCVRQVLRHGDFKSYLRSERGKEAKELLSRMQQIGFNTDLFTSDNLSSDIITREETSLTSWERNFDSLIQDLSDPRYAVFFMRAADGGDILNRQMRDKVLGLSSRTGFGYVLNKVKVMLEHCKRREAERKERGKVDDPLKELDERLETLQIQMEFGGRPSGGMIYSRAWHRTLEDLSKDSFMLCCAALGGDKQDLTFKAMFNPTYIYVTHFIHEIDRPLGFSILKAGMSEGNRSLLAISPYEANPTIRTALGEANTYRYVLDSMTRTAFTANADTLLIDDIDLKVRDQEGNVVRYVGDETRTLGQDGYEQGEDIVITYRKGEPCAPRSFRKFMEKTVNKYGSVTHEDVSFEQIEGDNELVDDQFGNLDENTEFHYSIQSVRPVFDPKTNYRELKPEETKQIFDQGYGPQNGTRTAFKVDLKRYIEERKAEGIDLMAEVNTIHGN